jgi:RNA recognition motif-containing protein
LESVTEERAAKPAQEAGVTVKEMVFPSTKVTFGAGVTVQSVLTGYESCRVLLKNLPLTATKAEVITLFTQPGFDPTKFSVYPPRPSNDRSHLEAVVEFEDMEDGKNAVAGLDEIEFGLETLKLAEITSKQGGMGKSKDLNSIILTVTWPAPSGIAFASYSSMDEARSKRAQLENKIFNGRKVKTNIAKKPATLPEIHWNPATISISGLNPGTPLTSIQEFCGTTTVRMPAKNARSYDLDNVIPSLRSLVVQAHPENHQSLTYEPNLVANENGLVTVKIRFPTWEHAKVVRDFLDQKPVPQCTQTRFFASLLDPLHYTTNVPFLQYKAQEKLFQSLIPDKNDRSATTRLRILTNQPNKGARIELSGSDKKTIGKLKVRIEQLTAGEKLPQWDRVFYGPEGERFLEKVYRESRAYIRVDKRQSTLKVFGEPAAVEQAKTMVQEEVDRLASRQFEVPLKRASIRYFMDGARGLEVLKQEVGEGNVMLNVSSVPCKIVIQGGEAARHCLRKLIDESLSDAIRSQHQLKDGETCPVCYDNIDQPYRLDCGHAYCYTCLNHFLLTASDTKQFPLSCMGDEATCGLLIPFPVIRRFLLPAQVKRLLEVSFLDHVGRNPGKFKYCATPGCPEMYSLESDSGDGIFRCPSCFVSVCVSCGEDHDGFSCEEWKIHQDPEAQERLLEGWAEGSKDVKKCPTCKILIEKNGGCNHMTCPKCNAHICWRCMGVFTPATIYGHMEDAHGGMMDIYG